MSLVVPAVLPATKKELEETLALITRIPSVSRMQIDVVDGKFASPACWPYTAPQELRDMVTHGEMLPALPRVAYEVDLMCLDALDAAGAWLALGATRLTFHAESTHDLPRLLASARRRYGGAGLLSLGLALDVTSDLALVEPVLDGVEYVQFMGIARIGQQGQPFDPRALEQVRVFRDRHPETPVQVDGGMSLANAKKLVALGVSNLVIGSGILRARDPAAAVAAFNDLENPYGV